MFLHEEGHEKDIQSSSAGPADRRESAAGKKLRERFVISLRDTEPRVHHGRTDTAMRDEFPDTSSSVQLTASRDRRSILNLLASVGMDV